MSAAPPRLATAAAAGLRGIQPVGVGPRALHVIDLPACEVRAAGLPPVAPAGSILAPILIGTGRPPREVAPAALASTFVTAVAGVITFLILSVHHHGPVAPDWPTGIALGIGGLAGAYTGARIQQRLPDTLIRRVMGVLVVAIGARYLWSGLG